jgi:hypothetical protein
MIAGPVDQSVGDAGGADLPQPRSPSSRTMTTVDRPTRRRCLTGMAEHWDGVHAAQVARPKCT